MIRRVPPMLWVAIAAIACGAVCMFAPGPSWVRAPFAVLLLLLLPGFALWSALMPHGRRDPLRVVTYSVGLSLVVAVVGGVELGAYGALSALSWSILMVAVTLPAAAMAHLRRREVGEATPAPLVLAPRRSRRAGVGAGAVTLLALLAIGAAVGLARTPLPVPDDRGYTVLTIGTVALDPGAVTVRIESSEADVRRFRLKIHVPRLPDETRAVVIAPGQTVSERVALPPYPFGQMTAVLVDDSSGTPQAYRRVRINLPVQDPAEPVVTPPGR